MVPGRPDVIARMATPQRYTEPSYLKEADPDVSSEGLQSEFEALRVAAPALHSGGSAGYMYQMMAAMGWTSLPWLWLIRQPTLILAGNKDPVVPPVNAKIMKKLIPRSKLYIFNGGHMGLLTHAKELAAKNAQAERTQRPASVHVAGLCVRSALERVILSRPL